MHCGVVELSSQLFVLLESSGNKCSSAKNCKLHLSRNGDFSWNHRWPLTLVVSFAAVIKEIDYDTSTFLSANIFIYITTMWRLVTCARQGTPSYQVFYTGLTFQMLAVENCSTDRRSIKGMVNVRFHICERLHESPYWYERSGKGRSWTVELACDSMEGLIKIFRFSTLGAFTATKNALVEFLRRTEIQVCICMIFNDYNMT